jgi:hypothetical protein
MGESVEAALEDAELCCSRLKAIGNDLGGKETCELLLYLDELVIFILNYRIYITIIFK